MKIKKIIPIAIIVLLPSISLISIAGNYNYSVLNKDSVLKPDTGKNEVLLPKNTIYLELLGQTRGIYSVNYERCLLTKGANNLSIRIGATYFRNNYFEHSFMFCDMNYIYSFNNSFFYEIGIGPSYGKSKKYLYENRSRIYGVYGVVNTGFRFIVAKRVYFRTNLNFFYVGDDRADLVPYFIFVILPDFVKAGFSLGITF